MAKMHEGRLIVRNSSLVDFSRCERKGALSWILGKVPRGNESAAPRLGTEVHRVLRGWYGGEFGTGVEAVRAAMATFEAGYREFAERVCSAGDDKRRWGNASRVLQGYLEQNMPEAFPFRPIPQWLEVRVGDVSAGQEEIRLDEEREDLLFQATFDMVAWDERSVAFVLVDHKTTSWLSELTSRQYAGDPQGTGYLWAAKKWVKRQYEEAGQRAPDIQGMCFNMIETKELPSDPKRKCKKHGTTYSECGRWHVRSELLGPYVRTPEMEEGWRVEAIRTSEEIRRLFDYSERCVASGSGSVLDKAEPKGLVSGACTIYGACEFLDFCRTGASPRLIDTLLEDRKDWGEG